jgi:hypothetical protein
MAKEKSVDTSRQSYARATLKTQTRFLAAIEQCGRVLTASRWAGIHRSLHYRWLDEDPTYPMRFQDAEAKFTQCLKDEAIRRAHEGVVKLVLYKGKPVRYQGQLLYEHEYSDHLMIKLLEAGDPDHFNRQKVAPFDEDFDYNKMTEGQIRKLLGWLRKRIETAKSMQAIREPEQLAAPVEVITNPDPNTLQHAETSVQHETYEAPKLNIPSVFKGDGWPYKVEKKRKK